MVQSAMSGGGIMPASTHGRPISQIISERWPWRAMLGGMGDEKRPASGKVPGDRPPAAESERSGEWARTAEKERSAEGERSGKGSGFPLVGRPLGLTLAGGDGVVDLLEVRVEEVVPVRRQLA